MNDNNNCGDNRGDKPQGPDNGGGGNGNPWMKSLLIWVGILLALAVFVTMFDGRTAATSGASARRHRAGRRSVPVRSH